MEQHFIDPLPDFLRPFLESRVHQVQLEVERFPQLHPHYAQFHEEYKRLRTQFEAAHSECKMELGDLLTTMDTLAWELGIEAYKQGAADCAKLLNFLLGHGESHEKEAIE